MNWRNINFLLVIIFLIACRDKKPKYFELGKQSYNNGNYPLAKSQFLSVKSDNPNYEDARLYLNQIDSIEKSITENSKKNDSLNQLKNDNLREKFSGNYKIEVSGVSSESEVEIYQLEPNGKAQWLWIYYRRNGTAYIDDRKIGSWFANENGLTIDIRGNSGMISETYIEKDNELINKTLKKRRLEKTSESY